MTGGALWRRYLRYTEDMTGTGDYINDPTEAWDCAPRNEFIEAYVEQLVRHETNRTSWDERQKNSVALRAKLQTMADRGEIDE